ncbi:hypothetical protein AAHE18_07G149300 [Arachis hypogaea]
MVENREREREGVGVASHVTTEAFIFGFLENVSAKIGFPFFSDFPCHFPSFPIPLSKLTNQRFSPPSLRNAFASFQLAFLKSGRKLCFLVLHQQWLSLPLHLLPLSYLFLYSKLRFYDHSYSLIKVI